MGWLSWEAARFITEILLTLVFGSWVALEFVRYWRRPRLAVSFEERWSVVGRDPPDEKRHEVVGEKEVHVFVRNAGDTTARACEGVLEKVERHRKRGWVEDPNVDLTPAFLEWAYTGGARTIDIPPSKSERGRRLSVFRAINEKGEPVHISCVQRHDPRATSPAPLKKTAHYRLHVAVHCENGDSSRCVLEIDHHGRTDVDVEQVQPGEARPRLPFLSRIPALGAP